MENSLHYQNGILHSYLGQLMNIVMDFSNRKRVSSVSLQNVMIEKLFGKNLFNRICTLRRVFFISLLKLIVKAFIESAEKTEDKVLVTKRLGRYSYLVLFINQHIRYWKVKKKKIIQTQESNNSKSRIALFLVFQSE